MFAECSKEGISHLGKHKALTCGVLVTPLTYSGHVAAQSTQTAREHGFSFVIVIQVEGALEISRLHSVIDVCTSILWLFEYLRLPDRPDGSGEARSSRSICL
jgi:hypothetical protein